ncbi:MAG: type VII toxin-antitoxin system HepT family RNase toxin [Candidatus Binatia bacterium]
MTTDVALAKLATIDRCLKRIRSVTRGTPDAVDSLDTEEIVVLNLQRAIQAAIDLTAHLISARSWGLPDSLKDHFRILESEKVVDAVLAARLQAMVGFRNIAVHDYERIDRNILKAILRERLNDLESFANAIRRSLAG